MTPEEAQQKLADGRRIFEQLGGVALSFALACQLPETVDDLPIHELERIWWDQFEARHREWLIVLNGHDQPRPIKKLGGLTLDGGASVIVCDNKVLALLTPLGEQWFYDPDTEARMEQDDVSYWRTELLEALYTRLTETGKDLPPLEEIRDGN